jgi:acetyl-CoA acyltransferase
MREVAIVSAVRTAIGKGNRGSLKDTRPDDLLGAVLKAAIERAGIDPAEIDDIVIGNAAPEAEQGMNIARVGAFLADIPDSVPAVTINRFCSSGLQSLGQGAASIIAGWQKVVLTGGVESMSQIAMGGQKPCPNPTLMEKRPDLYMPMGLTAEIVAERYNISRSQMDEFSLNSHDKALDAISSGRFNDEIVPVSTRVFKGGSWVELEFKTDEGPRPGSSMEKLAKLRSPFKQGGQVTAASSSQVSDGAAATLLMDRELATERGLEVLGVLRSYQVVGCKPDEMGVGPKYAIPKALEAAKLSIGDIDLFEINEAFASQALYCARELGIDQSRLNVNGGAIALGHPLGCTGARLTTTLLHEMKRRNARYGIVSMCIGGGMGAAAVFENPSAQA